MKLMQAHPRAAAHDVRAALREFAALALVFAVAWLAMAGGK